MTSQTLTGPSAPPANGEPAKAVVVLVHGYGADGDDLFAMVPVLAQAMPWAAFHAPHAPYPCEMAPYGRQWFGLAAYDPEMLRRDPKTMAATYEALIDGARQVAPALNEYIDGLLEQYSLGDSCLAILGFSQGTMLSLHVALRRANPMAALLGFSGGLVGGAQLANEITARPPVQLIHGAQDPVVPMAATHHAEGVLGGLGVEVNSLICQELEHGINEEGLREGLRFLKDRFDINQ